MLKTKDRERFIPVRKHELIELLCCDGGLHAEGAEEFRQLGRLLSALFHYEYYQKYEELKTAYAPFDPDPDTRPLWKLSADEKTKRLNQLFCDFAWLMERANFKHLTCEDLEPYLRTATEWGLRLDVDFSCFERLAIFARGDVEQTRTRRRPSNLYRLESATVPVFQRLVLIVKLRPHHRLSAKADTESVYLKIFKDIPRIDLNVLLPGARVLMTFLDRGKIGVPLLTGMGTVLSKPLAAVAVLFPQLVGLFEALYHGAAEAVKDFATSGSPSWALWGLASGSLGYGYRSFYGYQQTKQRYRLTLTENLYFQNLDNNFGVLVRLLDEAEEQECREALLAYFFLWRRAGAQGWTSAELDAAIETYLEQIAGVKVEFEIGHALRKLEALRLVEKAGEGYRACPPAQALRVLDAIWDSSFTCKTAGANGPPPGT
jgi:hypothetical protein